MNEASTGTKAAMQDVLERQRRAHINDGPPTAEQRIEWIDRAIGLLVDHKDEIADAMRRDFGHRAVDQSMLTDISGSIAPLKFAKKNLRKWMKPEKRKPTPGLLGVLGAKCEIHWQPKGVVGVISPWNFPVQLTFGPLANIFAAGNRVMIKPSEFTPATSELMARMFAGAYDDTEVAVFTGGPEVGQAFSSLPFDHLLFTGATAVGRKVMMAAAENLVPVTLELGGKSPVVLGADVDVEDAAKRIMTGKMMNAGQICLAPDYVLAPKDKVDEFVDETRKAVAAMYPTMKDNPDYTSVVNQRHYDRLMSYVEDAKAKGATVVEINPSEEDFSQQAHHRMPAYLILDPTDDMKVMQEEIFGPVMPVKTYDNVDEAIAYVNAHDRPLALYYFGPDQDEEERVVSFTTSGGVTINDVIMHVSMEDLPFGGIGPSGMGHYHGIDGFRTFSHARAIYRQAKIDVTARMRPPYTGAFRKYVMGQIKR